MAPDKKRPGEKRRQRSRPKRKKNKPSFNRPREWAEQELIGVRGWLKRLKGPGGLLFPEGWRRGQIRHYEQHARKLKAEIVALKAADKATESDPGEPSNVA